MPKRVDHDERRRDIADALCRIAARGGIGAATFREVAAEAGVSVRLVQYYFGTKADLLHAANERVAARAGARITRRLTKLGADADPRRIVQALVREFLPTDDERREETVLFNVFYTAQMTDPALARGTARHVPQGIATVVAKQIRRAQESGDVAREVDAGTAALLLTVAVPSIASSVVVGYTSLREARRLLDAAVDRAFAA
jgi:AcrR family transcriptional regulator